MGVCQSNLITSEAVKDGGRENCKCRWLQLDSNKLNMEGKTSCPEAANEFTARLAEKSARRFPSSGSAGTQTCSIRTCPTLLNADFDVSHQSLLGRWWNLPVVSSGDKFSFGATLSIPSESSTPYTALSLPTTEETVKSGLSQESGRFRPSRWISLVCPIPASGLLSGSGTGLHEGCCRGGGWYGECNRYLLDRSNCSGISSENSTLSACFFEAKGVFAFRISGEESTAKDAAFLRKRGLHACRGTYVRRWDRVECFSASKQSNALTIFPMKPSSCPSSLREGSPVTPFGQLSTDDARAPSTADSGQESSRSSADRNSVRSSSAHPSSLLPSSETSNGAGTPMFPKECLHCHHFATVNDLTESVSCNCMKSQTPLVDQGSWAPNLEMASYDTCDSPYDPLASSLLPKRRGTCAMIEEPLNLKPNNVHEPKSCGSAVQPVPAGIIVSCFDISIDPSKWKECGYRRAALDCLNETILSSGCNFGEGVVTSVMYGGMCVVECPSEAAVARLQDSMRVNKWDTSVSSKSLKAAAKRAARKGHSGSAASGSDSLPHDSYRVVMCVGGKWPFDELDTSKWRKGDVNSISADCPHAAASITPWIDVDAVALIVRNWAVHLLSHMEYAKPLAAYVQRFQGLLPFLRLAPAEDILHDYVHVSSGSKFTENLKENEAIASSWVNHSYLSTEGVCDTTACSSVDGEGPPTRGENAPAQHVDAEIPPLDLRSVKRQGGSRGLRFRSKTLFCSMVRGKEALSREEGGKSCTTASHTNYDPLSGGGGSCVEGRSAKSSSSWPSVLQPLPYDEEQVLWERAMLEVKAVNTELRELIDARHATEKELAQLNSTLQIMKRLFLPHSSMGEVNPLCMYLTTALEEPTELPGRRAFVGGRDWFPCLAALLSSPKNALCSIEIVQPMIISSLPQLGMVTGLLYHDSAMKNLQSLVIPCDQLCGLSTRANAPASGRKGHGFQTKTTLRGESSGKANCGPSAQCFRRLRNGVRNCKFFLTPKQVKDVFLALTTSVSNNSRHPNFVLSLKGFPVGGTKSSQSKIRRFIHRFFHVKSGWESATTQKPLRASSLSPAFEEALTINGRMDEMEFICCAEDDVCIALRDAERRPHCMLLRRREKHLSLANDTPGYSLVSGGKEGEGDEELPSTESCWVYGLHSERLLAAVMECVNLLLLDRAPQMFETLKVACDRRGSKRLEGAAATRHWGGVTLTC
ncbi:hypothetical protein, conserved [Trypanosoma brucei gambiense DAL972]|uniref:Uncharacterized protein n=1 Tax=Trypanosoma brucei gambiense (strain MHOM/CI/86/DAL972) TaxID=679716 RepID=C9ZVX2_TRYB9|nr:hypothetical protein, conserved [Trypanosoma brucei gambiense DAL972]CBH13560.1 hypothetical protein, conserved [Trypanosoma brucei gambiense DAL972]|eukprot:XP_011775837.1 hypothetical protein, conserved [Trypanosoma brucei gambiense DAL972]